MATTIITHIDKLRVYLNHDDLLKKSCLEIATNAGTVEFVLDKELVVKIYEQLGKLLAVQL